MSAKTLLKDLRSSGAELSVEGGKLTIDAPVGAITEDLRDALVENKPTNAG